MSDVAYRSAFRELERHPLSLDARRACWVAWERAGRPVVGRDPRKDPRPGDVVGVPITSTPRTLWRNGAWIPNHYKHPDGTLLLTPRCVLRLTTREDGVRVRWQECGLLPPEPEGRIALSTPRADGSTSMATLARGVVGWPQYGASKSVLMTSWKAACRYADVLWIEPDVWLNWWHRRSECSCDDCRAYRANRLDDALEHQRQINREAGLA